MKFVIFLVFIGLLFGSVSARSNTVELKDSLVKTTDLSTTPIGTLPLLIGVSVGFDFLSHNGTLTLYDTSGVCCQTKEGQGTSVHGGLNAYIPVQSWLYFNPRVGIEGRGGVLDAPKERRVVVTDKGLDSLAEVSHAIDVSMRSVVIDLLLAPVLLHKNLVYLCGGLSISIPIQRTFFSYEQLSQNNYANGTPTRSMSEGKIENIRPVHFEARLGMGAIFQLKKALLVLELLYGASLNTFTTNATENWKSSMVSLNVGIMKSW